MAANEHLQAQINALPHKPGVYKYFDEEGIIYVGKAIDLRKRVSSYFTKNDHNKKTQQLVRNIKRLEFTIVDSESDAFLLENNLIKQHQPKYNILLKDGKTYPYLCLTNERFPRLLPTRQKISGDGARYYGPYASGTTLNVLLELVRALYPLRTCNYNLSPPNVAAGKFKVCLEYHLGNCKGPCEDHEDEARYGGYIQQIRNILNGDLRIPKQYFREQMAAAAQDLQYELAHQFKIKLDKLDAFQAKSTIVSDSLTNIDVFAIASNEKSGFITYLKVMNGSIILTQSLEVQKKLDEDDAEILAPLIMQMRQEFESESREILTNVALELPLPGVGVAVPQIGDKRKLLELALKNVLYARKEKESMSDRSKDLNEVRIMETLKKDLRLTELPKHIECFDNSNFQGDNPVAAMVCFRNARASKKDYRHYHIKTVIGPNDFDSMYEVVSRRYRRLVDEGASLPQLVIVDGGKGQLSMAVKALKDLNLWGQMAVIGIAKRLEEIYVPNDPLPLYIDKKSESLRLIQRMRDEVHRFGITFHRSLRDAGTLKTELTDVKGLGPVTAEKLLNKFKSVKKIRELTEPELIAEVGKAKAKVLQNYFAQNEAPTHPMPAKQLPNQS